MKNGLIELIKKNYKDLDAEQVDELADKIYGLLPTKKRKLCDIKVGETFKYAGYEFTKLADEENGYYCLLNDTVFESRFGDTNDWSKSPIRKRLNEFDKNGKKIFEGDIVKVGYGNESINGVVKYHESNACWLIHIKHYNRHLQPFNHPEMEVLANITDNPELLEAVK